MDTSSHKINLGITKLIFSYMKAKHPLAASIPRKSVLSLSKSLTLRLDGGAIEFDFTPDSLKLVENLLVEYHANHPQGIPDDETLALIRELSAYIGEVLARHTEGKWVLLSETIWSTRLEYEGHWILLKEGKRRSISGVSYSLADIAATAWQEVLDGKMPEIYHCFKEIKEKRLTERLTYHR